MGNAETESAAARGFENARGVNSAPRLELQEPRGLVKGSPWGRAPENPHRSLVSNKRRGLSPRMGQGPLREKALYDLERVGLRETPGSSASSADLVFKIDKEERGRGKGIKRKDGL